MSVKLDVAENALAAALFIGISRTINIALVHVNLIGFRRRVVGTPAILLLSNRVGIVFRAKIFAESVGLVDTDVYFPPCQLTSKEMTWVEPPSHASGRNPRTSWSLCSVKLGTEIQRD